MRGEDWPTPELSGKGEAQGMRPSDGIFALSAWALAAVVCAAQPTLAQVSDVTALTSEPTEDDFPSIAAGPDGRIYVAWVSHDTAVPGDAIMLREWDGQGWMPTETVTRGSKDAYRVEAAVDGRGRLVLVWAENIGGNWELVARWRSGGRWSKPRRLTKSAGPDVHHRLAVDRDGRVWLCWQGYRDGNFDIFLKRLDSSKEIRITTDPANDWDPAIAIDSANRIYVVWDSYRHGSYDVLMRSVRGGELTEALLIAASDAFEAHAAVAADGRDRIWIAWDDGGTDWGKDRPGDGGFRSGAWKRETLERLDEMRPGINLMGGLHRVTRIGIRCWDGAQLLEPVADFNDALAPPLRDAVEFPALVADGSGRLWVLFRHNPRENPPGGDRPIRAWAGFAACLGDEGWSQPMAIPNSGGRNQQRIRGVLDSEKRLRIAWAGDGRTLQKQNSINSNVHVGSLASSAPVGPPRLRTASPVVAVDLPKSRHVRHEMPTPKGRLDLYWGDLHRHTEISGDGVWDGSVLDMYRYGLDAAALDFITTTDHSYGNSDYHWWLTQKLADVFHVPGHFAPLFAYERSIPWPIGHRNIVNLKRGYRVTPRLTAKGGEVLKTDTPSLWERIRGQEVITIPHTIAGGGGTDWTYHDPDLQPVMEIYQGCRLSYETAGAPKARPKRGRGDKYAAGYAWSALAKGYKVGFIAASDHRSTHISYAAVYARDLSRQSIFEALKSRHTYAATENIILDVRIGDAMMGDAIEAESPVVMDVAIVGTAPLTEIDVVRNNEYVYSTSVPTAAADFRYRDNEMQRGQSYYYYVRVQQEDEQMAWSSPIWVTYRG